MDAPVATDVATDVAGRRGQASGAPWFPALPSVGLRVRGLAVALLAAALAVSSGATLVACGLALIIPQQLDEGEPLIYGLASRIITGQPLYQRIDQQPFVQVHYTPLYYYLIAALRVLVGHGFAPGRLLSLLAGVCAAALIGGLAAGYARSRWAGAFAVLIYLGLSFPGGPAPFVVLERVDMLGVALSVATIAVLAHGYDRLHLILAGGLAALGLLTKQSLFAAALAGTLWLATLSWRKAGLFALTVVVATLLPAGVLEWSSSGAFWHNIGPDNPDPTALAFGAYLFRELVVIQGIPTILAAWCVISRRAWRDPALRLIVFYWLASMISVLGIIKVGANHNYWIELAGANAILSTLTVWMVLSRNFSFRSGRSLWSLVPIILLGVQLAVLLPARFIVDRPVDVIPPSWTLNTPQLMGLVQDRATFNDFVDHVRGEQTPFLAESMDVAVLSGHPVAFEPFAFSMLEHDRRWNSQPLVDDICNGRISLLVLSHPLDFDTHPVGLLEFPMWPPSVFAALQHAMQLESVRERHWLYRPPLSLDAAAVSACRAAAAAARV